MSLLSEKSTLLLGTRGSELALVQAAATEALLGLAFPDMTIDRKVIKTTGDRRTDVPLSEVAKQEGVFDKGVFIKEIEDALDAGQVDIAVHSLKDLPTVLDGRFALAAVLQRAPVRDALVTRKPGGLSALPPGARVGTSSVRRARQIQWLRPDVQVVDLRGNVPTRLMKLLNSGEYEAILLAEAGLVRLGFVPVVSAGSISAPILGIGGLHATPLDEGDFFPAAGQGAIALEIRADDPTSREIAEAVNHPATWVRIVAEREFLRLLDGGCDTPVGVYSSIEGDQLFLKARVFPESGGSPKSGAVSGPASLPIPLALELFNSLK